ncbi:hypothetical protein Tco_0586712 [Tanacetum coccineum]
MKILVVPEPVLEDEDEDLEEEEFEEEEYPQEKKMKWNVHEVGESFTTHFLREDNDGLLPGLMRRDINSLFGRMTSFSRRLCSREMAHALVEKKGKAKDEYYVEKLGSAKDKVECKKLKKELEEARFSNTFLQRSNETIEVPVKDKEHDTKESRGKSS